MSRTKSPQDWLDWAQAKYDAAQERYAWMERADSSTMDSYSTLVDLIEAGIASKSGSARPAGDEQCQDQTALIALAKQMEALGKGGFVFNAQSMVDAAHTIRKAVGA